MKIETKTYKCITLSLSELGMLKAVEIEPPKPAYSAPEKVKTKEVNRVAYCLKNLVSECSLTNGSCDKCHYHDVCPMSFERDSDCVAYWTTE